MRLEFYEKSVYGVVRTYPRTHADAIQNLLGTRTIREDQLDNLATLGHDIEVTTIPES